MRYILSTILVAVLSAGALSAQSAGDGQGITGGQGGQAGQGQCHKRHHFIMQHLKFLEHLLATIKKRIASGECQDPQKAAEAVAKLEQRIANIKAKIAEHKDKHHEGRGERPERKDRPQRPEGRGEGRRGKGQ